MSLIVEDGTGLTNAQSYISLADANAYHLAHGNTTWAGTDVLKESALIRATTAIDGRYANIWPSNSYRLSVVQALDWPRWNAFDVDGRFWLVGVPQGVKDAVCEAALIELLSPGELSVTVNLGVSWIKVGPIEEKYSGVERKGYPQIGFALRHVVKIGTGLQIVRTA